MWLHWARTRGVGVVDRGCLLRTKKKLPGEHPLTFLSSQKLKIKDFIGETILKSALGRQLKIQVWTKKLIQGEFWGVEISPVVVVAVCLQIFRLGFFPLDSFFGSDLDFQVAPQSRI